MSFHYELYLNIFNLFELNKKALFYNFKAKFFAYIGFQLILK